jgi:UDPglucose 6-dehydrogenase
MKLVIVGSGVVGQATGKGFAQKGHSITFCDINPMTLTGLRDQGYQVCSPDLLHKQVGVQAFFFSISTPTVDGKIQLGFLEGAVANFAGGYLKETEEYTVVVIRSTVPPGTTEERLIPLLEKYSGKRAGPDFGVCMNPEYLREGSNEQDFLNPWIVVIGELDQRSGDTIQGIYGEQKVGIPTFRIPLKDAEAQKYIHNLWNATKISFFNEMRVVCRTAGVNTDKVFPLVVESAEAQWNPEYGIRDFGPFGGSCLPKDTTAFLSWSKEILGLHLPLLKSVILVNDDLRRINGNGGVANRAHTRAVRA